MKKKAFYAAEADIPEADKHLYVSKNGRWEFNTEIFDDLEGLVLPGLTTNRDTIKAEKTAVADQLKAEKDRADGLQKEIDKTKKPGMVLLDKTEAQLFEDYKKLGAPADLEKKVSERDQFENDIKSRDDQAELNTLADEVGVDKEALADFKKTRGEGLSFYTKTIKTKDPKNSAKEIETKELYVGYEEDDKGVMKKREAPFKQYAEEKKVPTYLITAIFSGEVKEQNPKKFEAKVRIPNLSKTSSGEDDKLKVGDEKSFVQRKNEQRSTRRVPWKPVT